MMKMKTRIKNRVRKMRRKSRAVTLAVLGAGLMAGTAGFAQQPAMRKVTASTERPERTPGAGVVAPIASRWKESFDAFDAADLAAAPKSGGVVFVGSSSIRLWSDLEKQFDDPVAIIKRGFGGSRLQDCTTYLQRLVLPYKPRLVVVYAGDNDLAEGRTPQQVMESYAAFVEGVHAQLPDARIAYISIKPSPLRSALMESAKTTNDLIAQYSRGDPRLDYIDVHSRMLDAHGQPRAELFQADRLHMNEQGYALWKSVIAGHLRHSDSLSQQSAAAAAPPR